MYRSLTAFALLLLMPTAQAQSSVLHNIEKCHDIKDDHSRLACYDNLAVRIAIDPPTSIGGNTQVSSAPQATQYPAQVNSAVNQAANQPISAQQAAAKAERDFGLKTPTIEYKKADSLSYTIASMKKTLRGKLIITFTNGQEWEQTDDRDREPFKGDVRIEEAALGAFMLYKPNSQSAMRVKRIK